jgi:microcystin-dependent protein
LPLGTSGLPLVAGAVAPSYAQVAAGGIATNAVTTDKINNLAVTTDKLAANSVTLAKLATAVQNLLVPVGSISAYAGATAPTGWLLCDGTTSTSSYPQLAALVGATTPDLKGRTLIGVGTGAGLTARALGDRGGAETHTLTEQQIPSHTHIQNAHGHDGASAPAGGAFGEIVLQATGSGSFSAVAVATQIVNNVSGFIGFDPANATATNQNTGGGQPHNNMQPFQVVNYIIKHD